MDCKTTVIANTKGGSTKSTTATQCGCSYSLMDNRKVKLYEFDDENKDSENFSQSAIIKEQVYVGDGSSINSSLRNIVLDEKRDFDIVIDVGGNKTTSIFLEGLKSSRMYKKIDLFIIPMSGGSQDLINAIRTYETIVEFYPEANIIFALGRVRKMKNIKFQYSEFFKNKTIGKLPYFSLLDSDVIDLSRRLKKTVSEISQDKDIKEQLEKAFDEALEKNDNKLIGEYSLTLEIYDDSEKYLNEVLVPSFEVIKENLNKS